MASLDETRPWRDESSFWLGLHTLYDPIRVPYFRKVLTELGEGDSRPRLLDLGAGAGFVAEGLADVADVTALDVSFRNVSQAQSSGVRAVVADAESLPMPDAQYRAVVASEMLEHVDHPADVINEAARVTRTGGLLLFSTPSRTLWSRLALISLAQHWPPTRVLPVDLHDWNSFLNPEELDSLFRASGWRLIEVMGVGVRPGAVAKAIGALAMLKTGRIGYAEAGRRIELSLTTNMSIGMIGYASRIENSYAG
jgi:2-polyprenyl-6-hydroxyphenyl methylase/3-demethylubiquinone-9 3-methyltransferase